MSIPVRNNLVKEILDYLKHQPTEDTEAQALYHDLLAEQIDQEREEMKIEGEFPQPTKAGAYII